MRAQRLLQAVALSFAATMVAACGGGSGSLGGAGTTTGSTPGGSTTGGTTTGGTTTGGTTTGGIGGSGIAQTLTFTAAQPSVIADGQSTDLLTATLTDTTGLPIANATVSYSTNAGTTSVASSTTDSSGQAFVRLQAPTFAGRATVIAREASSGISAVINVTFISGAASNVSVVAAPGSIKPGSVATFSANVTDAKNNPVSGEPVQFSVTTNASGGSLSAFSALSDSSGVASVTYTAGSVPGSDSIQAKITSGATGSATLAVSSSAASIGAVKLTIGSASIPADGASQSAVQALVSDSAGNPVQGAQVSFSATAGTLSAQSAVTASNGIAQVTLKAPTQVGSSTVRASVSGFSNSGTVSFVAGAAASVTLDVAPQQVSPNQTSTLRATVLDANGNRVPNESVTFSSQNNRALSVTTVTTDANGQAASVYTAASTAETDTVSVITSAGKNASKIITVAIGNPVVNGITLTTGSTQVGPNGTVAVRATVQVASGSSSSGINVSFGNSSGTLSATTAITDNNGNAQVILTAPSNLGTVSLTASTSGFNASGSVQVVAGAVASLVVSPAGATTVAPGSAISLTSQALDSKGNPVSGQTVQFSLSTNNSGARIAPATAVTDASGYASSSYSAGGTSSVTDSLIITSGNASQSRSIAVSNSAVSVGSISIVLGATSVTPGTAISAVATLQDNFGRALSGVSVNFTTTAGTVTSSATSDSNGRASVTVASPNQAGSFTVTAASGGYSAQATATVTPGTTSVVTLSASPISVAPGRSSSLTALAQDGNGNPISGKTVVFTLGNGSQGTFGGTSATQIAVVTDTNGFARTTLAPSGANGTSASVLAMVNPDDVASNTVTIGVSSSAVAVGGLQLVALTASATAGNGNQPTVRATVTGSDGSILQGVPVTFTSTFPSDSPSPISTGSDGTATYSPPASAKPGSGTVTASTSGFSQQVTVQYSAGAAASVALGLSPPVVSANGTTRVSASVLDANQIPVPNVSVNFSIKTNSSGGQLAGASATTDVNGIAITTYTAGAGAFTTSVDTLQAVASTTSISTTADLQVTVQVATLTLSTSNTSVTVNPANCTGSCNSTTLTAQVLDSSGKPVAGAPVAFTTNLGTLASPSTVNTNASGNATITLTAPSQIGSATVNARINSSLSQATGIRFVAGPVNTVAVAATPANVAPAGSSTLTATVTDAQGNPVTGETLQFSIPTNASGAALSTARATTAADGTASVIYTAGPATGTDSVQAASTTVVSATGNASIAVNPANATVSKLTLALSSTSISADAGSVNLTATVLDNNGNPAAGQTVTLTTASQGSFSSASTTTTTPVKTDSSGTGTVTLNFPSSSTAAGTVRLRAAIAGLVDEQVLTITPGAANASKSTISANPSSLVADGKTATTITVLLNDASGNPLTDGTSVTLLTTGGTLSSNTTALASGRASFTLTAPSSSATASVSVQGVSGLSTQVNFTTATSGNPASIQVAASANSIAVTGTGQNNLATLTFTVLDSSGNVIKDGMYPNGVPNLRVSFVSRPNGGETLTGKDANNKAETTTATGALTDNYIDVLTQGGVAVVTLQAGTRAGIVEVKAAVLNFPAMPQPAAGDPSYDLSNSANYASTAVVPAISIAAGPATTIVFSYPTTNSILNLGGGTYARKGQVFVTDQFGNAVADNTVVNLEMLDSAIVHDNMGATTAGSNILSRNGNSLITLVCQNAPTSGAFASMCGTPATPQSFTSTVNRNGNDRTLQVGDGVYLQSGSYAAQPIAPDVNYNYDKKRSVNAVPSSATQLTTNTNYRYSISQGTFWAGSSLLGGNIGGVTSTSSSSPVTTGSTTTSNGVGNFLVTYPANPSVISNGCFGYASDGSYSMRDRRDAVPQSRQVVVVASSGSAATTIREGDFCFSPIAPFELTQLGGTSAALAPGSSASFSFNLTDCGPKDPSCNNIGGAVPLPLISLNCAETYNRAATSDFDVTFATFPSTGGYGDMLATSAIGTDLSGNGILYVTRIDSGAKATPGDSVTLSCSSGASVPVTFTVTAQ